MAIPAINPQSGDVVLMAERNRLWPRHPGIGYIGRALQLNACPENERDKKNRPEDGGAGDCVSTAMKNLHPLELSVQRGNHFRSLVGVAYCHAVTARCDLRYENQ